MDSKKKPITVSDVKTTFYQENSYGQNLLAKALTDGITDPLELRKLAGMRTTAEVYRCLDKLALRREYHTALSKSGIGFGTIADKLKELMDSPSQKIQLGAVNALMKSLGLEKYEQVEDAGKSWEEELIRVSEEARKEGRDFKQIEMEEFTDYEVVTPETPTSEKERQENERKIGRDIYET